jgi:hypothetical protein
MSNPDVIQGEEIRTWTWVAAIALLIVLAAAMILADRSTQVASIDPNDLPPPLGYQMQGL